MIFYYYVIVRLVEFMGVCTVHFSCFFYVYCWISCYPHPFFFYDVLVDAFYVSVHINFSSIFLNGCEKKQLRLSFTILHKYLEKKVYCVSI